MDHQYASKVASIIGAPLPINAAATILQELNKAYAQGMANGAAQEREQCAKVCDDLPEKAAWLDTPMYDAARDCAAAIRARGQA